MPASYRASSSNGSTSGTGDRTATITSIIGDLLIVFVNLANNHDESLILTDDCSDGLGTYSQIDNAAWLNSSLQTCMGSVFIRDNLVKAGDFITITASAGSNDGGVMAVIAVQGMTKAGMSAVRGHADRSGISTGSTGSVTLPQAALSNNMTLVALVSEDTTTTPPASWTERVDANIATPTTCLEVATRNSGFTGSTITWGDPTTSTVFSTFGIELDSTQAIPIVDNVGASDAFKRISAASRNFTTNFGLSSYPDLHAPSFPFGIALVDYLGLSDVYGRLSLANLSLSDTLAANDPALTADPEAFASLPRESIGWSDVYSRQSNPNVVYVDLLGLFDLLDNGLGPRIFVEELIGIFDSFARTSTAKRGITDSLGLFDVFGTIHAWIVAVSDLLGLNDPAFNKTAAINKSLPPDKIGLFDVFARTIHFPIFFLSLLESLGTTDVYDRQTDASVMYEDDTGAGDLDPDLIEYLDLLLDPEVMGVQDDFTRFGRAAIAVLDTIGALDVFSRLASAARSQSDTFGASDAFSRQADTIRPFTDTFGASDAFQRLSDAIRALDDTVGAQDNLQILYVPHGIIVQQYVELLGGVDAFTRHASGIRVIPDSLGGTEAFDRLSNAARRLSETLAAVAAFDRSADATRGFVETLVLADVLGRITDATRFYSDTYGSGDAYARIASKLLLLVDSLGESDRTLGTILRNTTYGTWSFVPITTSFWNYTGA